VRRDTFSYFSVIRVFRGPALIVALSSIASALNSVAKSIIKRFNIYFELVLN
jgi:hypothetical protein